ISININNAHYIAVFLAEKRHCALRLRLLDRHFRDMDFEVFIYLFVHNVLDCFYFCFGQTFEVGKVKAQSLLFHKGTGLVDVTAKRILERLMKQMCCCMVLDDEIPVLTTDSERICLTRIDCSAEQFCNMYILAVRGFVDRCDFKPGTPALDGPLVCDLSAAHSVERRPVEQ